MGPKQFEPKPFRFKVRNPDGSDGHQAVVDWPHPSGENPALPKESAPAAAPAVKQEAKPAAPKVAEKKVPEAKKAEPGQLVNPSWARTAYEHGEKAEMLVEAPSLDGRKVRFIVERHATGEKWDRVAEVTSTVSGGRAKGSVEIQGDAIKDPRCVREKGQQPLLVVDTPGIADGREVQFAIEMQVDGNWQPQSPALGVVKGGKAEAKVKLVKGRYRFHSQVMPALADGNLRFRAELA